MIRVEVTDEHGTAGLVLDPAVLLGGLTAGRRARLSALAADLTGSLAAVLGTGERHAAEAAVALLTRLTADEAAYERVTASRLAAVDPQGRLF